MAVLTVHYLLAREDTKPKEPFSNSGFQILIVGIVLEFFAIASALLRLYVRIRLVRVVALDDVAMVFGLLCASAVFGLYILAVTYGLGNPLQDIPAERLAALLKAVLVARILYHPAILFIKASIIFFILRLTPFPGYRKILWATLVFTALHLLGAMIVTSLQCHYLDNSNKWCIDQSKTAISGYVTSGGNIFTDIMLVVFPIPLLWNAPVPKRKKNILRFVLSLGVFVTAAAVIRLIYMILEHPIRDPSHRVNYIIWTIVELHVGIIVVNIPTYAPLVKSYLEQQRKRSNASLVRPDPKHRMFKLRVVQNTTVDVHMEMIRPGTKSSDGKSEWGRASNNIKDSDIYLADIERSRVDIYVGHGSPSHSRDIITELPAPPHPVHLRNEELPSNWPLPPSEDTWPLPPFTIRRKGSNFSMQESRLDFT